MITFQIIPVAPFSSEPQNFRNRRQQIFRNHQKPGTVALHVVEQSIWCSAQSLEASFEISKLGEHRFRDEVRAPSSARSVPQPAPDRRETFRSFER
jgi:hypothetical protein